MTSEHLRRRATDVMGKRKEFRKKVQVLEVEESAVAYDT